eukprot:m.61799 g.61799  ORF g.61799 m.61799 type:complete len:57 (-) comp9579_c0_seq1:174-344(-)
MFLVGRSDGRDGEPNKFIKAKANTAPTATAVRVPTRGAIFFSRKKPLTRLNCHATC